MRGRLVRRRLGVVVRAPLAHHVEAQGGVRQLGPDVHGQRRPVEHVEVLGKRLPAEVEALGEHRAGDVLHALHEVDEEPLRARPHRGEADPAVAEHGGGDAVPRRRGEVGVPGGLAVVVGVDVDPAGQHQGALGVDLPAAALAQRRAHGDHPTAVDGYVTRRPAHGRCRRRSFPAVAPGRPWAGGYRPWRPGVPGPAPPLRRRRVGSSAAPGRIRRPEPLPRPAVTYATSWVRLCNTARRRGCEWAPRGWDGCDVDRSDHRQPSRRCPRPRRGTKPPAAAGEPIGPIGSGAATPLVRSARPGRPTVSLAHARAAPGAGRGEERAARRGGLMPTRAGRRCARIGSGGLAAAAPVRHHQ